MMAGTIAVAPQARWSAAGWLFDWTIGFLAGQVSDPVVAEGLREIVSENLGWLAVEDFGPKAAHEMRSLIQRELLTAAHQQLPADLAGRADVLSLLAELVAKASYSDTA